MIAKLELEDNFTLTGNAFGSIGSTSGEVVFNTGMVGYPESLTDPSYEGQILVLTYPLIGNYGVPNRDQTTDPLRHDFESERIHIAGLVVSEYSNNYSHWKAHSSLDSWLKANNVAGISGVDTRRLTQKLREQGTMLGRIVNEEDKDIEFVDPNLENLVAKVSPQTPRTFNAGKKIVLLIDCGCKFNIIRSLMERDITVKVVPWDWDISQEQFDGMLISNGPGDPKMCKITIKNIRKMLQNEVPILGICLGNQLLALAAGANTFKLKYGHRSQNQPCILVGSKRCFITSQNHGFAIDDKSLPDEWEPWFFNANDGTIEGIRHSTKPFFGVQFHPEASPGPLDTAFLFDDFIAQL